MSSRTILCAGLVISSLLPGAVLFGQSSPQTSFSVAAGLSVSTGDFGQRTNAGFDVNGAVTFQQPGQPLGIRLEGLYNQFAVANEDISGNVQITAITVNAVLTPQSRGPGRRGAVTVPTTGPYLIGGLGLYNVNEPSELQETINGQPVGQPFEQNVYSNDIGFNIGGGYRFALSGFIGYVEARYHTVANTDYTFVPIVFGITF